MKSPTKVAVEFARELGWRVFPANPNNKKPLISRMSFSEIAALPFEMQINPSRPTFDFNKSAIK